jgi:transposase
MVCIKGIMHIMGDKDTRLQPRRRVHSAAFKRELVLRSLQPGASVSAIALEAGINANLLFGWRKTHLAARVLATVCPGEQAPVLLPVEIAPAPRSTATAAAVQRNAAAPSGNGSIEIEVGGARVRVRGVVDETALRNVLRALRDGA